MSTPQPRPSRKLEKLAMPLIASFVPASPGDVVRFARESDGTWFCCRVDERMPDGDLLCTVVDAESWSSLMTDGILPGVTYAMRPDRVLYVVKSAARQ